MFKTKNQKIIESLQEEVTCTRERQILRKEALGTFLSALPTPHVRYSVQGRYASLVVYVVEITL